MDEGDAKHLCDYCGIPNTDILESGRDGLQRFSLDILQNLDGPTEALRITTS